MILLIWQNRQILIINLKNVKSNKNKLNELLKNAKYQQKFNKRFDK